MTDTSKLLTRRKEIEGKLAEAEQAAAVLRKSTGDTDELAQRVAVANAKCQILAQRIRDIDEEVHSIVVADLEAQVAAEDAIMADAEAQLAKAGDAWEKLLAKHLGKDSQLAYWIRWPARTPAPTDQPKVRLTLGEQELQTTINEARARRNRLVRDLQAAQKGTQA